jgi:hypothetical protein
MASFIRKLPIFFCTFHLPLPMVEAAKKTCRMCMTADLAYLEPLLRRYDFAPAQVNTSQLASSNYILPFLGCFAE